MTLKSKVDAMDDKIHAIYSQAEPLREERANLINSAILNCQHELLYSSVSNGSPYGDDEVVCRECGLSFPVGIGGKMSAPMLNTTQSEYVIPKGPFRDLWVTYRLNEIQVDALKFPKRFEPAYLAELLANTPFDADAVLEADEGRYCFNKDQPYTG